VGVGKEIVERLPATLSLAAGAVVLWMAVATALAVVAASRPRQLLDRMIGIGALLAISGPVFVFGYLLLFLFGSDIGKLPLLSAAGSYVPISQDPLAWLKSLVLPWLALSLPFIAVYARFTRAALIDVLQEDFIRTARAKGLSERRVLLRHGVRRAIVPIITLLGLDIGQLLGGVVFIEAVFNLPGIGTLAVAAVQGSDLPTIQGVVLAGTFFIVIANLAADLLYARLDPRINLRARKDW
jgi:peptide/nickel transport system permease protein